MSLWKLHTAATASSTITQTSAILIAKNAVRLKVNNMEALTCRFGHECTSRCGNDIECPCQADHCCAFTYSCEGGNHCDDHYDAHTDRIFSPAQKAFIAEQERKCKEAGCDDNGHKHD